MHQLLSGLALLLVAVTMGLSLAHALEFPGKLRLDEATYRAVQAIYYPGFTIGGLVGEFGGMIVLTVLLVVTPAGNDDLAWFAAALASMVAVHATYWIVTHPVNSAWLKNTELGGASRSFFRLFSRENADWRHMRKVWEWSHVARTVFAACGFLALIAAVTG